MHPIEQWRLSEQERRGKSLPRYQLAQQFGCSASRLTQILRGGQMPSAELAMRIREVTGIATDQIFDASRRSG